MLPRGEVLDWIFQSVLDWKSEVWSSMPTFHHKSSLAVSLPLPVVTIHSLVTTRPWQYARVRCTQGNAAEAPVMATSVMAPGPNSTPPAAVWLCVMSLHQSELWCLTRRPSPSLLLYWALGLEQGSWRQPSPECKTLPTKESNFSHSAKSYSCTKTTIALPLGPGSEWGVGT
jgi:hypothetical protein